MLEFDLPVNEIRAKERLVDCYSRLMKLSGNDVEADIPSKSEQLKQQINALLGCPESLSHNSLASQSHQGRMSWRLMVSQFNNSLPLIVMRPLFRFKVVFIVRESISSGGGNGKARLSFINHIGDRRLDKRNSDCR